MEKSAFRLVATAEQALSKFTGMGLHGVNNGGAKVDMKFDATEP